MFKRYPKTTAASLAAAVALSTTLYIKPWEGEELRAYQDIVGVWTACFGETKDIKPGMTFTRKQCDWMLAKRALNDYAEPLSLCIDNWHTLPVGVQAVVISLGYNVGVKATCGSTLVRKLEAGDLAGACRELPKWNKAGGKAVKGLTNRRAAEMQGCLKAVGGA